MTGYLCPCTSSKNYKDCCRPFHEGRIPENALQLMRSRYAAFALDIPDYIIQTTHPASSQYSENTFSWKRDISSFSREFSFDRLEILDFKEKNSIATVTFIAYLSHKGNDASFTEKSLFERYDKRWLYKEGQVEKGRKVNFVSSSEQLNILPLAYFGDPILRKKAAPIQQITDDLKTLVQEMIETMDAYNGIGIAAPQVHQSLQLFITRKPVEKNETITYGEVEVFINPILSCPSAETCIASEGCLSVPTLRLEVVRPNEITVEYTDLLGERMIKKISGRYARMIMHENDHLEGVLFFDYLDQEERLHLEPFFKNLEKRIQNKNRH